MHLETLRIKNYKSFKEDQTVAFGRCNMIVGKNGSGKSNLLNAIESA
ncbi:AAA family ATPase, partial [Mixta mediterraneensis]